jgi:hypothetical protein
MHCKSAATVSGPARVRSSEIGDGGINIKLSYVADDQSSDARVLRDTADQLGNGVERRRKSSGSGGDGKVLAVSFQPV